MAKQPTAVLATTLLLAGCAGVGLQEAGVPGASWQRVAYQEEGDDPVEILEEGLKDLQDAGAGIWWILGVGLGAAYIINESDDEEDENRLSYARSEQLQRSPQPLRRWQRNLEDAAAARVSLWQPAPYAATGAEGWRCEVGWRCYATDPDTRERTELLGSGTAWYEDQSESSSSFVCFDAKQEASKAFSCRTGIPYYEEWEVDHDCSCRSLQQ